MNYRTKLLLRRFLMGAIVFMVANFIFFYNDPEDEYESPIVRETKGFVLSAKRYIVLESEDAVLEDLEYENMVEHTYITDKTNQKTIIHVQDQLPVQHKAKVTSAVTLKTEVKSTILKRSSRKSNQKPQHLQDIFRSPLNNDNQSNATNIIIISSSNTTVSKNNNQTLGNLTLINSVKNLTLAAAAAVDHYKLEIEQERAERIDICLKYNENLLNEHEILVNYFNATNEKEHQLSLITQLTHSRLVRLRRLTEYWKGPISATIYMNKTFHRQSVEEIKDWFKNSSRSNIRIHYVFQEGDEYLPINKLRNVAQDNSMAEYVFLIDIDFVPYPKLETRIAHYIDTGFFNSTENNVMVVPATELLRGKFPETKTSLLSLTKKKRLLLFHAKDFPPAHTATNFTRWKTAKEPYKINYKIRFEPYIVIKRSLSPAYDERFLQRFFNKVVHIYELKSYGFQFWVMPDGYLVHLPHKKSRGSIINYRCTTRKWNVFRREVMKTVKKMALKKDKRR